MRGTLLSLGRYLVSYRYSKLEEEAEEFQLVEEQGGVRAVVVETRCRLIENM